MSDTPASESDLILYRTDDGQKRIEVRLENENINHPFAQGELEREATFKDYLIVRDGPEREPTVKQSLTVQTEGLSAKKGIKARVWIADTGRLVGIYSVIIRYLIGANARNNKCLGNAETRYKNTESSLEEGT